MSSEGSNPLIFAQKRNYGKHEEVIEVPNLVQLQLNSYDQFLQMDIPSISRNPEQGLEAIIREIFPIFSYDKQMRLEYICHELGKPRYTPDECRKLKLTYGAPFKIRVRLTKPNSKPIEEEVYLGEIPIMIGGGEFIINGSERVIVSQLHRSPGVDFDEETHPSDKRLHSCWIIPERGSWIEINVTKKDTLTIRIDQTSKIPATTFLRSMSPKYSSDEAILALFHPVEEIKLNVRHPVEKLLDRVLAASVVLEPLSIQEEKVHGKGLRAGTKEENDHKSKRIIHAGTKLTYPLAEMIVKSGIKSVKLLVASQTSKERKGQEIKRLDPLIVNTLDEDSASDRNRDLEKESDGYETALLRIYSRLRPGNPSQLDKAKTLFREKFYDTTRYRLGRVGRFRLNRKFGQNIPEDIMTLTEDDIINSIRYILKLRAGEGEQDDIDHLGNRRVRTIIELAGDEFRKGFMKLKRTIQDRMNLDTQETMTPKALINSKTISSAIEYFFGRGELSQVVDQTNPLAQLTHERRLSALGPGGLNRKRAGFEVRDVHISHYGRICPIETPEGTNIGLISSLSIYATIDEYGFLTTPYCVVKDGRVTKEVRFLRADEEHNRILAPADTKVDADGKLVGDKNNNVMVRINGDFKYVDISEVEFIDVSPKQLVGVSSSLIPFLEHNDANRALMGSNMQRQAVPLMVTEPPIVATGMEKIVARNSSMVVTSEIDGVVTSVDSAHITVSNPQTKKSIRYELRKFVGLNERTCLNQKPIVHEGERVKRGQVIADGAATCQGELALGRNVLVAFMPWDGYNFEDAIIVSEKLVREDYYTSIHIDEFETEIRETKLGREEFTCEIPNVNERALSNLDENGIVRIGTVVKAGDILVGKVAPKSKSELSPEEKLLHAIFGRAGEDVKNDSLEVPSGTEGIIIHAQKFSRKGKGSNEERQKNKKQVKEEVKEEENKYLEVFKKRLKQLYHELDQLLDGQLIDKESGDHISFDNLPPSPTVSQLKDLKERLNINRLDIPSVRKREEAARLIKKHIDAINEAEDQKIKAINFLQSGDELPTGVLELVKVYIATKRVLSVGDKIAGRHGNKGVIAKILPEEDMPFLADGTPIEIILNPLGVPSRMNVGQILETHLGWAAQKLGFQAISPVFDGCSEKEIEAALEEAGLPTDGKITLYDGRTGEPFEQKVTVGYIYMMKLHHLVDNKVHARATGPYSLITQQPLGGKARFGGQRFGEMEVWALEAYGVANVLQELLTVKSDDVDGRTKIYESMVKGENTLEPGTPVSFEVLTNEIKGLALDMRLKKKNISLTKERE